MISTENLSEIDAAERRTPETWGGVDNNEVIRLISRFHLAEPFLLMSTLTQNTAEFGSPSMDED